MTIGWKVPCQTLNDYLSFVILPLQLRAFKSYMYGMTIESIIYRVIDLKFYSNKILMKHAKEHQDQS
jgi:hypothetical protein